MAILAGAAVAAVGAWRVYAVSPWTRDGQVVADVVRVVPQVSGRVVALLVADNQEVKRGDVLFRIERIDFELALAEAQANEGSRREDLENRQREARRRAQLSTLSTSREEQETFESNARVAAAAYAMAVAQVNRARLNLERTEVRSPVGGFVTNLLLREGDTATTGAVSLAVVDGSSFRIVGYFEETKLGGIRVGDEASAVLIGSDAVIRGHVEGIARGINTPNAAPGVQGLASVNPVFTWVRLAQRIPVRIAIDGVPAGVVLAAGLTATVTVGAGGRRGLSWWVP